MHCAMSGLGDYLAKDEIEALDAAKLYFDFMPQNWKEKPALVEVKAPAAGRELCTATMQWPETNRPSSSVAIPAGAACRTAAACAMHSPAACPAGGSGATNQEKAMRTILVTLATVALLEDKPHPTDAEIRVGMDKHLCRCCGYTKIEKAISRAANAGRR